MCLYQNHQESNQRRYAIVPTQVAIMRFKLAGINHCAVPLLSRTAANCAVPLLSRTAANCAVPLLSRTAANCAVPLLSRTAANWCWYYYRAFDFIIIYGND